jgi:2-amino-4-hydroxy-6-hydroxymethyldihydropteridine diphosphokinase
MEEKRNDVFSVFLSLGSNLGDKEKNIKIAYNKIEKQIGEIKSSSAFFYSSPVGFTSDNCFVNSACEVLSEMSIYKLFAITQGIEKEIGRVEKSLRNEYSDRIIDIDIIMAGNMIIDTPELTIPHPRFHEREFVLIPLSEIAPNVVHPILKMSIRELKEEFYRKFY